MAAGRSGAGAIRYPSPEEVAGAAWTDEDRRLVADRTLTQFVGSAATVTRRLDQLAEATDADELIITTITSLVASKKQAERDAATGQDSKDSIDA